MSIAGAYYVPEGKSRVTFNANILNTGDDGTQILTAPDVDEITTIPIYVQKRSWTGPTLTGGADIVIYPLGATRLFSPNSDGINDRCPFIDFDNAFFPIKIYNVENKQVAAVTANNKYWDGAGCGFGMYYYITKNKQDGKIILRR